MEHQNWIFFIRSKSRGIFCGETGITIKPSNIDFFIKNLQLNRNFLVSMGLS